MSAQRSRAPPRNGKAFRSKRHARRPCGAPDRLSGVRPPIRSSRCTCRWCVGGWGDPRARTRWWRTARRIEGRIGRPRMRRNGGLFRPGVQGRGRLVERRPALLVVVELKLLCAMPTMIASASVRGSSNDVQLVHESPQRQTCVLGQVRDHYLPARGLRECPRVPVDEPGATRAVVRGCCRGSSHRSPPGSTPSPMARWRSLTTWPEPNRGGRPHPSPNSFRPLLRERRCRSDRRDSVSSSWSPAQ